MIIPLKDRIILKQEKLDTQSDIGLVVTTEEKYTSYGTVVAIDQEGVLKIGDRVLFNKFSGDTVRDGDEEFLVVPIDEVLCIIK